MESGNNDSYCHVTTIFVKFRDNELCKQVRPSKVLYFNELHVAVLDKKTDFSDFCKCQIIIAIRL